MQRAAPSTPAARPLLPPRPQSPAAQQPPAAYGSGQHPSYSPPGAMPQGGIPIPRAMPVAASAAQMSVSPPVPASSPMSESPYPYQAVPSIPTGGGAPVAKKRGFPGFITALFIIIVLALIGGGIYYFINQAETPPPSNGITDITDITTFSIQSGPSSSSITKTGATIKWETNEPATSQVKYGTSKTYSSETPEDTDLSTSHSIKLTGLDAGTTYYFKVISKDAAGNEITAEDDLTTLAEADEIPPTISGVSVSNITESSATITWKTNEKATSQVEYGKTETYDSKTVENTNLTPNHTVTLNQLDDGTTYYFQVISKDSSGNVATSDNQTFETTEAIPVGYEIGNRAPEFTLNDLNGNEVKLTDFRGEIVIVNFWFTLCGPCTEEFPLIQAVSDNWTGEDLEIVAINYEDSQSRVLEWINNQEEDYTFTILLDPDGAVNMLYNVSPWPTTFFIDAEGIIQNIKVESFGSQAEIQDMLDDL
jgi:peroxiredoxin